MSADRTRTRELKKFMRDIAPIGVACGVLVLILIVALLVVIVMWFGSSGP